MTEHDILAAMIYNWAVVTFGPVAKDPPERAARLVEEAAELAQSMGTSREVLHAIIDRAYARPRGDVVQELGGVMVCTYSICALTGNSPMEVLYGECNKVTGRDPAHWRAKHDEKIADGTANVSAGKLSDFYPKDLL